MSAPEYVVVEDEPGKAALLKLKHEGGLVYQRVASGPASLVLESIAETLNEEAAREAGEDAENIPEKIPAPEDREAQLDAMVIHHEAGRHPELHADRRPDSYGRTAEPEEASIARGRQLRAEGEARLARRAAPIGFSS